MTRNASVSIKSRKLRVTKVLINSETRKDEEMFWRTGRVENEGFRKDESGEKLAESEEYQLEISCK